MCYFAGIGKATALRAACEGARSVINYLSDAEAANALVEQIGSDRALAVQAYASKLSNLDRLVEEAVAKLGRIDILIPNAGILPMKDLANTSEAGFDKTFNLMAKGPYFLAQGFIEQMTRVIAQDLARKGILVSAIAPGPTTTDLFLDGQSDQVLKAVASNSPFNRIGEPKKIAAAMMFLCGKNSSWMSGQVMRVNGAMT
ncbi:hypothetical protein N7450_004626 [Penicillium hetheringtonii]|uniref:Uncharacterized protein n=1 Tax=Penicillium hetheringtonii TaxID=911720 RepID=A0AAD6GWI0_9EURO|nr:hypothetical protein N7450_004626 [Penicillium hetheringtonii]